ncbi:MAG: thiolase domain-containing protein [Myxococcales bacterium]|nr:thiolase domain-containing protein [Myxococcales bacterium]
MFVLGGAQTDFARNWSREGLGMGALVRETVQATLAAARVRAEAIGVGHVANFLSTRFTGQGHLGALLVDADRGLWGCPSSAHEAACASGGVALMAAMADLESGRYDCALVIGVELMRNVKGEVAAQYLGAAAAVPDETDGVALPWPTIFSEMGDVYAARYGLARSHLVALARNAFSNAKRNPSAQTRHWVLEDAHFEDNDRANPVVAGRLRKHDCSQVTDGGAGVVLATRARAEAWARAQGQRLEDLAVIAGWGHRVGPLRWREKVARDPGEGLLFGHVAGAIGDAFKRAGLSGVEDVDAIETHDCFTTSAYMAIDHFGLTPPGRNGSVIDDGAVLWGGRCVMNPSGGLMGVGHPVGATGVRMVLDAALQVTGRAGATQVANARRVATLNLGGSATTAVCTVLARGPRAHA